MNEDELEAARLSDTELVEMSRGLKELFSYYAKSASWHNSDGTLFVSTDQQDTDNYRELGKLLLSVDAVITDRLQERRDNNNGFHTGTKFPLDTSGKKLPLRKPE